MGVHHDAGLMVDISPDHIGGLSPHARKGGQLLQRTGYLSAEPLYQVLTAGNDVFGLVMVKTRGMDILLQLLLVRLREVLHAPVLLKKIPGDDVHPGIRALGA